jgi:hypothetical protein
VIFRNSGLGGLEVRRVPRDMKVAGSILTSGGGIKNKMEFVIFLSHWSLGNEIRRLALSDNGDKQEACVHVAHIKNPLAVGDRK